MIKEYINYLKDNPKHLWFKAKLFGWGWTPATWQGWITLIIYLVLVFFISSQINESINTEKVIFTFILPLIILTAAFIILVVKKGEKPKWSWGLPKDKKSS